MQNLSLETLGIPPNAWAVDETTADITRPPLPAKPIVIKTPKIIKNHHNLSER